MKDSGCDIFTWEKINIIKKNEMDIMFISTRTLYKNVPSQMICGLGNFLI